MARLNDEGEDTLITKGLPIPRNFLAKNLPLEIKVFAIFVISGRDIASHGNLPEILKKTYGNELTGFENLLYLSQRGIHRGSREV